MSTSGDFHPVGPPGPLRHRMALRYLTGARVSVNETAYLVGFSEPAAFVETRAGPECVEDHSSHVVVVSGVRRYRRYCLSANQTLSRDHRQYWVNRLIRAET